MRDKYKALTVIANEYINEFNNDACNVMEKTAAQINSLQAVGFGLGLDLSDHCIKFYFSFKKANGNIFKMYCSDVYLDIIKARSVNATNIDFANMGALLGLSEDVCKQRFHLNIMPLLANNNHKLRLPWGVILKIAADTCYSINTVNDLLLYGVNVNNRDHDAVFYAAINEAGKIAATSNGIITYEDIGNWIDYCYDKSNTFNDDEFISEDDNEIVENDWDIDPEELLSKKQQIRIVADCIAELNEQDHEILNKRFEIDDDAKFTLNRIAIEYGLGGRQVALNRETLALQNFRRLYRLKTKYGIGENK